MTAEEIRRWLVSRLATTLRVDPTSIDERQPFDTFGLSSTDAVTLSGDLEELLGRALSPTLVYEYPSIVSLSGYLSREPGIHPDTPFPDRDASLDHLIAIIGIGCRFPGASGPSAYWDVLRDGVDVIREVPSERWNARAVYHPESTTPGKAITRWGAFLDNVENFDPFFFGISPGEAERMDPQQRLLLEVAYEAFEDAGYPMVRLAGMRSGVFVGISINEYGIRQFDRLDLINGHSGTGSALSVAANRISYFFDLHGPSMAVDTACSSSLVAVHLACRSLRSGECELAVAGGVNLALSPAHSIAFTKAGVLSRDGHCKVFDASADGYVRGEGAGLVVLKSLAQALADGDPMYAVIRGSAIHQDGRTNGLMAPSREAQEAVLRDAYRDAGVSPSRVQYVEAHGTGTLLGDSIEARALGAVVGSERLAGPCRVGSVKSNVGHLEAAAGVAGLIKVALALKERALPPSLHFKTPNPHIPFEELGVRVQDRLEPWPEHADAPLAGVSSFGFGGTNVHVVVEAAPEPAGRGADPSTARDALGVLPLSAHTPDALATLARAYRDQLFEPRADDASFVQELGAATSLRRNHLDHRIALVTQSPEELRDCLDHIAKGISHPSAITGRRSDGSAAPLAFVFSGQGSQWVGMGRELLRSEPVFRDAIEECDRGLRAWADWSVLEQLQSEERYSRLDEIAVIQPTLFALQVALAKLWQSWGIVPDAVVGHSMGEVAAAHVAGALALEDAARVICARSRLLARLSGRGGMAVVGLSAEETEQALAPRARQLSIAASNSPTSTVVSGDRRALESFVAEMERRDTFCTPISVDVPAHSPQAAVLGAELRRHLDGLEARPPARPFVSTVTAAAYPASLDAEYWVRNLTQPVRFTESIQALLGMGYGAFVEMSPHPVLQSAVQQTVIHVGRQAIVLPSMRRAEPERRVMLMSLGALYASGRTVDWSRFYSSCHRPVALPPYAWQRRRFWIDAVAEPRGSSTIASSQSAGHPLIGRATELAHGSGGRLWTSVLDASRAPFLRDHRIHGNVVVPASAIIEIAFSAAAEAGISASHELVDLELRQALVLSERDARLIQVALIPDDEGVHSFALHARPAGAPNDGWLLHATASFRRAQAGESGRRVDRTVITDVTGGADPVAPGEVYEGLARRGLEYGPTMRGLESIWRRRGEVLARVAIPELIRHESGDYRIHPVLLDASLQALAAQSEPADDSTFVPVSCRRVRLHDRAGERLWSHAVLHAGGRPEEVEVDIQLLDDAGAAVAELDGLRLSRMTPERQATRRPEFDTWVYKTEWRASAPPARLELGRATPNTWVILADRSGIADSLRRRLEERGQRCLLLAHHEPLVASPIGSAPGCHETGVRPAVAALLDAEPSALQGVIHLWSVDIGLDAPHSLASLHAARGLGCTTALELVQDLADRVSLQGAPRLWLVTRGAQPVLSADPVAVAQAPLCGLGRTIGFEVPELRCSQVDLDPAMDAEATSESLFRELCLDDAEDLVAHRGGRRFVGRLVSAARPAACVRGTRPSLRGDATYLITGGLGGLGLLVAQWMVAEGARHLVLVSRRAPGAAQDRAIAAMRDGGATVAVVSVDVASDAELAAALEQIREGMPRLRGVVHAAGVLDNASIVNLDADRLARVMAPKVEGAWNVHTVTLNEPLDFFVLFSSAVSVLGSPGQGNYAAANSFLDALAHYRRRENLPAVSINWGPWSEVGLVAHEHFLQEPGGSAADGVKGIAPVGGLELLREVLWSDATQLTVLPFDLRSLLELYPPAARIPFFEDIGGKDTHVARLYARPDLQQEFVAPRNEIERKLVELWRQTLRIDRVGVRDSFFALGGDSVLAAQIVTSVRRVFGVGVDLRDAFRLFTIEHLAQRIEAALVEKIEALSESEAQRLLDQ